MHNTPTISSVGFAAPERKLEPQWLNEGQAAALLGVGRRKFHDMRQESWFVAACEAREFGPRALRWHRDELLAAAKNAPRRTVLAEPTQLAVARTKRDASPAAL